MGNLLDFYLQEKIKKEYEEILFIQYLIDRCKRDTKKRKRK